MSQQPEAWLPVVGLEGYYEVSDLGRVRSVKRVVIRSNGRLNSVRMRMLKANRHQRGYSMVSMCRNHIYTHRLIHVLVLEAFIGKRPAGMQIAHFNGIKGDNRLSNLRYATAQENAADSLRLGERGFGEFSPNPKLTFPQVEEIRRSIGTQAEIARKFGVSQSLVSQIKLGKVWPHDFPLSQAA